MVDTTALIPALIRPIKTTVDLTYQQLAGIVTLVTQNHTLREAVMQKNQRFDNDPLMGAMRQLFTQIVIPLEVLPKSYQVTPFDPNTLSSFTLQPGSNPLQHFLNHNQSLPDLFG